MKSLAAALAVSAFMLLTLTGVASATRPLPTFCDGPTFSPDSDCASAEPSEEPSDQPSDQPSESPSEEPSESPSEEPSESPSEEPTPVATPTPTPTLTITPTPTICTTCLPRTDTVEGGGPSWLVVVVLAAIAGSLGAFLYLVRRSRV